MDNPVVQNALQFRHLAESVSSMRGERLNVFAVEGDGVPLFSIVPLGERSDFIPAPIMELDTRFQQPRRVVPEVVIQADGMEGTLSDYDAVYWSEAAVEKFVFPYYASKSLWMAAHLLAALSRHWYGFVPNGDTALERVEAEQVPEDEIPFALAHLPTSDYVMVDEKDFGHDLHLLYRQPGKPFVAKSLADLLRAERQREGQNG